MKYKNIVSRFGIEARVAMELYRRGRKLLWHTFHDRNTQSFTRWNKISFWSKFLYPTLIEKTFIMEARVCSEINRIHRPIPLENITKPLFVWLNVVDLIRMYLSRFELDYVDGTIRNRRECQDGITFCYPLLYIKEIGNIFLKIDLKIPAIKKLILKENSIIFLI